MSSSNPNRNHELGSDETRRRATPPPRPNSQQGGISIFSVINDFINGLNVRNVQQIRSDDPDVLFRGALGGAIPEFSITVDRTNLLPNGRQVQLPTNEGATTDEQEGNDPGLIFNLNNLPDALRVIVERSMQSMQRPVVRATDAAIKHLKVLDPEDLPEDNKKCAICYEQFDHPSKHKKAVDVTERFAEIDTDPSIPLLTEPSVTTFSLYSKNRRDATSAQADTDSNPEHVPVQMPCKHIFGRSCLVEWLKQNVSCPLCRQEIEAEQVGSNQTSTTGRSLIINRVNVASNLSSQSDNLMDDPPILFPVNSTNSSRSRFGQANPMMFGTAPNIIIDGLLTTVTSSLNNLQTQTTPGANQSNGNT
ncbi:hypothetical protein WICPIJ_001686 [Wickerhamomyces pijperi]|uniref:RING-type domain-containing protein n=1 Tax=Wickerhamomyces pijperi TaxID=599730 RepID=A0A9P8QD22_WICPI|nr:hypothetical protein WICPIJ_001686 [Wickerhamomyces pijperi]